MRMRDPIPTFKHLVSRLKTLYPEFAYIHLVEPRANDDVERNAAAGEVKREPVPTLSQSNDFIREIWLPRPLITAGGYTRDIALQVAEQTGELIAFGRHFIANVSVQ